MNYWPLLDIHQAIQDCDRTLADVVSYVETLQTNRPSMTKKRPAGSPRAMHDQRGSLRAPSYHERRKPYKRRPPRRYGLRKLVRNNRRGGGPCPIGANLRYFSL